MNTIELYRHVAPALIKGLQERGFTDPHIRHIDDADLTETPGRCLVAKALCGHGEEVEARVALDSEINYTPTDAEGIVKSMLREVDIWHRRHLALTE